MKDVISWNSDIEEDKLLEIIKYKDSIEFRCFDKSDRLSFTRMVNVELSKENIKELVNELNSWLVNNI